MTPEAEEKKRTYCQKNNHKNILTKASFLVPVAPTSKTDPIMLLMAAAKVVDGNDFKKRHSRSMDRGAYPNGRYYLKQGHNKRIRTSPPSPAPSTTYKVDTWQKTKVKKKIKHDGSFI